MSVLTRSPSWRIARPSGSSSQESQIFLIQENPLSASFSKTILSNYCRAEPLCLEALTNTTNKRGTDLLIVCPSAISLFISQLPRGCSKLGLIPELWALSLAKPDWHPSFSRQNTLDSLFRLCPVAPTSFIDVTEGFPIC